MSSQTAELKAKKLRKQRSTGNIALNAEFKAKFDHMDIFVSHKNTPRSSLKIAINESEPLSDSERVLTPAGSVSGFEFFKPTVVSPPVLSQKKRKSSYHNVMKAMAPNLHTTASNRLLRKAHLGPGAYYATVGEDVSVDGRIANPHLSHINTTIATARFTYNTHTIQ